jgi:hypothetical protein
MKTSKGDSQFQSTVILILKQLLHSLNDTFKCRSEWLLSQRNLLCLAAIYIGFVGLNSHFRHGCMFAFCLCVILCRVD